MRRLLFLIIPIFAGILVFFLVTFILSQKDTGKGALQVTSLPQSNVYLNDKFIGQTPLCKCDGKDLIPTGDYTIRIVPVDSVFAKETFGQKITINKSVLTVVDRTFGQGATSQGSVITLIPEDNGDSKSGSIALTSFPSGVGIKLDGNGIGQSPLTLSHIVESDHDLLLSKAGYKDKTIRIHTVNGYTLSIIAFLAIDPNALSATSSAAQSIASSSALPATAKVTILDTPTGFLRVRSDPSLGGKEITQVKPGEKYDLVSEQSGWTEIKLSNGENGWVSSSYVTKQ
jgi:hypothetical protein